MTGRGDEADLSPSLGTQSSLSGSAGDVVQARDIAGGVHFHQSPQVPAPVPWQLPMGVAGFTGRHAALDILDGLITSEDDGQRRVAVISSIAGTAGVGKTALAVHFGHRRAERFPDGQLYVNLRGYDPGLPMPPGEALAQFLRALGVPPERMPEDVDERAGMYRSLLAGRRMLVVLDNARNPQQVRPLLPGTGGPVVVVTSRDDLRGLIARDGARPIFLDVLSHQEALDLLQHALGALRIRSAPDAADELVALCARLPLALRIAAAHLAAKPLHGLADLVETLRQGDRLMHLEISGDRDAAVAATLDLSYHALDTDARRQFRRLGLVPGPDFTPEAAAALTATTPYIAGQLLDHLASTHLIEPYAPGRFRFHDLLRLHARHRAETDDTRAEQADAIRRLYDYYVRSSRMAAEKMAILWQRLPQPDPDPAVHPDSPNSSIEAVRWFASEEANLFAATAEAARHGVPHFAVHLAEILNIDSDTGLFTQDLETATKAGLEAARILCEPRYEAIMLDDLAAVFWPRGQFQQAIDHGERALAFYQRFGDREDEAYCRINLGNVNVDWGRLADAAVHYRQALTYAQAAGLHKQQATILVNLGKLHTETGDLAQAERDLTLADAIFERHGIVTAGRSAARGYLGIVLTYCGRLDDAERQLTDALEFARLARDRRRQSIALSGLANVHHRRDQHDRALECAERALHTARDSGNRPTIVDALLHLGHAHLTLGRNETALSHAEEAVEMIRAVNYHRREAQASNLLANIHLAANSYEHATTYARHAAHTSEQTGQRLIRAHALRILGNALDRQSAPEALDAWRQAMALFAECSSPDAEDLRILLETHG